MGGDRAASSVSSVAEWSSEPIRDRIWGWFQFTAWAMLSLENAAGDDRVPETLACERRQRLADGWVEDTSRDTVPS